MNSYKSKYLKYKNKYLNLKNQIGGLKKNVTLVDKKIKYNCNLQEEDKSEFWKNSKNKKIGLLNDEILSIDINSDTDTEKIDINKYNIYKCDKLSLPETLLSNLNKRRENLRKERLAEEKKKELDKQEQAATNIQALQRGRRIRKQVKVEKQAATLLQSLERGRRVRREAALAKEQITKNQSKENKTQEETKQSDIIQEFNTKLINFINLSHTKPANYWQYYLNIPGNTLKAYEKYDKDHKNTYKDQTFKLVTNQQINYLVPSCNNLYQRLTPELRTENKENYILKYTLPDNSKIAYFGDYHSSLHSLIECIENLRTQDFFESGENNFKLKENRYLVFLGDLVDRGPYGIECLYLLYLLFLINNQTEYRVFILNGNHEEKSVYINYAFASELKYQFDDDKNTINLFEDLIKNLPLALFLRKGTSNWYQFCHGGIDASQKNYELEDFLASNTKFHVISTPEPMRGFLFSDFTSKGGLSKPKSGRGWLYTKTYVDRITNDNKIMTIISGHQDMINYGVILRQGKDDNEKYVWDNDAYALDNLAGNPPLQTLKVIQDDSNKDTPNGGKAKIDMKDVSATIISSSTIAKLLKFSIYGILDLSNDESTIIWFPSCNTNYLLSKGKIPEPTLCNKHLSQEKKEEKK